MGELAHLNVKTARVRENITLSVEALAAALAMAEDLAYRRALLDAGIDRREASRLSTNHEAMYATRCDLYASIWRRGGKGL